MATPPTFVASYGNTAWSSATQTASVTVAAGDLIVIGAGTGNSTPAVNTPSGGGLTYTLQQSVVSVTQQSNTYLWTAVSPSAQTFTLTMSGNGDIYAWSATVWRNHGGVGASAKKTATSTTSLSISTQAANSALVLVDNDYLGVNGSTRTYLTSVGAFVEKAYQFAGSGVATFYSGYHADSGAVGSKSVGMSAPTGQRPSLIALEVLAAPAGATGSLAITTTVLSSNVPPAVRIDINDTRSPGQATSLTVMRNNPDGTQQPVRTSDGNPLQLSGGVGQLFDYEMALGSPVSYTTIEAPGITSLQATVTSTQSWLVHPGVPSLSQPVSLRPGSLATETYVVKRGVFNVMGRANPVVVTDGARGGAASQLVLVAETPTALTALKSLFADSSTLLLNPSDSSWEFGPAYIAVGDVTVSRWTAEAINAYRDVALSFQVVDRPAGGVQSARSWADVLAGYGSWSAVLAQYKSWNDVLTGP